MRLFSSAIFARVSSIFRASTARKADCSASEFTWELSMRPRISASFKPSAPARWMNLTRPSASGP